MSDLLLQLYHATFDMSPGEVSKEQIDLGDEIVSRLGEGGAELFEAYHNAFYEGLKQEDKDFFLRTLALGMELGRLSVS